MNEMINSGITSFVDLYYSEDVIEKIAISGKALEILRIADTKYYNDFSQVFPSRTPYIQANSIESLNRPDIAYYILRII